MARGTRSRSLNSRTANRITNGSNAMRIEGLTDFYRALGEVDKQFPAELRKQGYDLARGLVLAARTKATTRSIRTPIKAARSLRAGTNRQDAYITGGGGRYPFFYGAEFGSKRYGQFEAWRGNQWKGWDGGPGYFLHPAIREKGPELLEKYWQSLDALTAKAFPD